ncbi:MAG TPA: hypothetical protein ENK18_24615 [Deltaproteobacteria bacterium]|nr:hypothetical protein [Deltaproteobacteria bacterium]
MIEVAVVLDRQHRPLHWHEPPDADAAALPDSRDLWEALWAARAQLSGVAHSHLHRGRPAPSWTDLTTFAACEAGLGVRLSWWIVTLDDASCFTHRGPGRYDYTGRTAIDQETAAWIAELRRRSLRDHPAGGLETP